MNKNTIIGFVFIVLIYFIVWPVLQEKLIEKPAQDFTYESITGIEGSLKSKQGGTVVLHFWATWCSVCKYEMPEFNRLAKKYNVLNIAGHSGSDDDVRRLAVAYNMNLDLVVNDESKNVMQLYNIRGFPTTVVVDDKGVVRFIKVGKTTFDEISQAIKEL